MREQTTAPDIAALIRATLAALAWIEPPAEVRFDPQRTFRFRLSHICRTSLERDRPAAL